MLSSIILEVYHLESHTLIEDRCQREFCPIDDSRVKPKLAQLEEQMARGQAGHLGHHHSHLPHLQQQM